MRKVKAGKRIREGQKYVNTRGRVRRKHRRWRNKDEAIVLNVAAMNFATLKVHRNVTILPEV